MIKNNLLLIIDPQIDFTDKHGSLYVEGAETGIQNICKFIDGHRKEISSIICTSDSHYPNSIFNNGGWRTKDGKIPVMYTSISSDQVKEGVYIPMATTKEYAIKYLLELEKQGKQHIVWPAHCLVGSKGQSFPDPLIWSLVAWFLENNKNYEVWEKGKSVDREMYSAFSYFDGTMSLEGKQRLDSLYTRGYDKIFIAGFAKDFCVAETVRDLVKDTRFKDKLVFLPECTATINPENPSLSIYDSAIENYGAMNMNIL